MNLSLAYSPCPNDCFIFDALIHGRIDTEGIIFTPELHDVETLNNAALEGTYDITKLSFHAYAYTSKNYILMRSGSALGFNCGPLLISRHTISDATKEIRTVAIPGKMTTANFLLSIALPGLTDKKEYVFSEIEDAVLRNEVDAGLIIHENRFTYQEKGLKKVMDLGEFWESKIKAPIPLGGIFVRRNFDRQLQQKINALIRKSVEYASNNPEAAMPYVREHAQAMSEDVMKKHIALYVNDFSVDLGKKGIQAVELLFSEAEKLGIGSLGARELVVQS